MKFLNLILSTYFNFRYLPLRQAIHLPISVTTNLGRCNITKGQLILPEPIRYKQILIGGGKSPGLQTLKTRIIIANGGKIIFHGNCIISQGTVLRCDKDATIELGDNFYCNGNCFMRSTNKIFFGRECLLGWNVTLNTTDGHTIWHNGKEVLKEAPIIIDDNVWITPNSSFVKGSCISSGCIVAQGAIVTRKFTERNCLIGGIPAKIVSHDVSWHV